MRKIGARFWLVGILVLAAMFLVAPAFAVVSEDTEGNWTVTGTGNTEQISADGGETVVLEEGSELDVGGAGHAITVLTSGYRVEIGESAQLLSGGNAVNLAGGEEGITVINYGDIEADKYSAAYGYGIALGDGTGHGSVIENYGTITTKRGAIDITNGDYVSILNAGTIITNHEEHLQGNGLFSIGLLGNNASIVNSGDIYGGQEAIIGVQGDDNSVVNKSFMATTGGAGIGMVGDGNTVTNEEGARITAMGYGIYLEGDANLVTNDGEVEGQYMVGVYAEGNENSIVNRENGRILGYLGGAGFVGDDNLLENHGIIEGEVYGAGAIGDANIIVNKGDGIITSVYAGVGFLGNENFLENHNLIEAEFYGVEIYGDDNIFVNHGDVRADNYGFFAEGFGNTLDNYGHVIGDVEMGDEGILYMRDGALVEGDVAVSGALHIRGNSFIEGDLHFVSGDIVMTATVGPGTPQIAPAIAEEAESIVEDNLLVTGQVTIDGGTFRLTPTGIINTGSFVFIDAESISGEFDNFEVLGPYAESLVLDFETEYGEDFLAVNATRSGYEDVTPLAGNALAMGAALTEFAESGGEGPSGAVIMALDSISDEDVLVEAIEQAVPEIYTQGWAVAQANAAGFASNVNQRLADIRRVPGAEGKWSPWFKGIYGKYTRDAAQGFQGYDLDQKGITFGFDKAINDTFTMGLFYGMADSTLELDGKLSKYDVDAWTLGVYGTWALQKGFFFDASAMYGKSGFDSVRRMPAIDGTTRGSHDGENYSVYVGIGQESKAGEWNMTPSLGLQYTHHEEDGFTETGDFPVTIDPYTNDVLASRFGVAFDRTFETESGGKYRTDFGVHWVHRFGNLDAVTTGRFAGTDIPFTVSGVDMPRDTAVVSLGFSAEMANNTSVFAAYENEFGGGFSGYNAKLGIRFEF